MKRINSFGISLFLLFSNFARADETFELSNSIKLTIPSAFLLEKEPHPFSSRYQETTCLRFQSKKTKAHIGDFCISRDKNLLSDMGIVSYDSIPEYARTGEMPISGLVVTTGMSQYDLKPFFKQPLQSYSAIIDCDVNGGPVYRATADCHVAVGRVDDDSFLYSSFVIKQNRRVVSTVKDIQKLWQKATLLTVKNSIKTFLNHEK